ncbi:HAD family phosphatase [Rhizobiaceae bacterium BDR2-2]|uniref:HAD family phosphatase n=1 Tax=Ectorhizobium quercum TaxID=2965071 RepID=A0AAE3SVW4_9HYPH|nr:HAD family phosphatase [Ectorhizobium quercum]MCX8996404.1 HAD family phosphatase [Ectorhizobium quercum]MCX8998557.1 HAD family phosphatase [Ectorhizobium quercum]
MTTPIRHIVFDIGSVLIHYDPELPFRQIIPDPEERRRFLETVCTHDWNLEQDRGRPWSEAEAELIARHPQEEARIRAFRQRWHEMVPRALDDSVAVMLSLIEAGFDVTMLTNFAADTFAEARGRFAFLNAPRGVTVSAEVGLIKPDIAIYRHHARSFGLTPENTLFIDDVAANVEGARSAGWQAIRFTGAEKLKADLSAVGIAV